MSLYPTFLSCLFLSAHHLSFHFTASDTAGRPTVEVKIEDNHSHSEENDDPLPLKVSWIPLKNLDPKTVDPSGYASINGGNPQYLYVARANYHDGVLPGQWNPATQTMLIGNTEKEEIGVFVEKASLLHLPKGSTSWVRTRKGQQFFNVVVGGQMPGTKVLLYICRAIQSGNNLVLGYRKQAGGKCVVSYAGDQYEHDEYELLCITDYGMVSGSFL